MIKRAEDGFTEVAGLGPGFEFKHGIRDADDLARVSERRLEEHLERSSYMTGGELPTELREKTMSAWNSCQMDPAAAQERMPTAASAIQPG